MYSYKDRMRAVALYIKLKCDFDQSFDDCQAPTVFYHTTDECFVDLDDINGEIYEMGERGVTGAEVIERNMHSLSPKIFGCSRDVIVVSTHKNRFINFENDMFYRDIGGCKLFYDPFFETAFLEIGASNINTDVLERNTVIKPCSHISGHLRQHLHRQIVANAWVRNGFMKLVG